MNISGLISEITPELVSSKEKQLESIKSQRAIFLKLLEYLNVNIGQKISSKEINELVIASSDLSPGFLDILLDQLDFNDVKAADGGYCKNLENNPRVLFDKILISVNIVLSKYEKSIAELEKFISDFYGDGCSTH